MLGPMTGGPGEMPSTRASAPVPNNNRTEKQSSPADNRNQRVLPALTVKPIALEWQSSSCTSCVICPGYEGKPVGQPRTICILWKFVKKKRNAFQQKQR